ncbi:MAG: DNA adenine methylase [Flavobacteriaceae bacterium]|nr:DNA adenine methylase [Flavobacteriaceae bacterium]
MIQSNTQKGIIPGIGFSYEEKTKLPILSQTSRSPLRYPGGKTRALSVLREYMPSGIKRLVSPFLGGGSLELSCAADGIDVWAADAFELLVNFWEYAQKSPKSLSERVESYFPLKRHEFYSLQKSIVQMENNSERAAIFFVLNRSSFSGITLSGGMSPGHPRFTESSIERLRNFYAPNLHVSCADFKDTLALYPDDFLYLDPPYANGGRLYGVQGHMHDDFDHEGLAQRLSHRTGWMLSYNDHPDIRKMYARFKILTPDWQYGMSSNKRSNELLILNV